MKEHDKTPEQQLSDVKRGNLSEKEFRGMTVRMIQEKESLERECSHRSRRHGMFSKDLEEVKNKQHFPSGPVVGNPPADVGNIGLIPGPGRSHIPQLLKPMHLEPLLCNEKPLQ